MFRHARRVSQPSPQLEHGASLQDNSSNGEAPLHAFDDVRDAIAHLVDLIKAYQNRKKLLKVFTSSVFKRREEEANAAIDRAVLRSNVRNPCSGVVVNAHV